VGIGGGTQWGQSSFSPKVKSGAGGPTDHQRSKLVQGLGFSTQLSRGRTPKERLEYPKCMGQTLKTANREKKFT